MAIEILLADPSFDHKGLRIPVIPLGTGLVAAYTKKNYPEVSVSVHKAATPLQSLIKEKKPAIVALTNYLWNRNLCLAIAEYTREVSPSSWIVFGGPEMDSRPNDIPLFKKKYQNVDFFIQHEGEVAFQKLVGQYLATDGDPKKVMQAPEKLGNTFFFDPSGALKTSPSLARIEILDDIPSPYLTGIFDHFLSDDQYMPMIQTNRGCPFSCIFCQEGSRYFSPVKRHSMEFIKSELDYIAARVNSKAALWITDSNWAMYEQDEETAQHIASIQKAKGWPTDIISSTGKANLDRIIRITNILNRTMYISNSVQSMNADVLQSIKRKNLSPKELGDNRNGLKGIRQEPELIVPLPSETQSSFFKGLNQLLDSQSNQRFAVFQTLILTNTEMAHDNSAKEFGFHIKNKQHFNLMGRINGKFVCEIERVVCATNTMSMEELCNCRAYAMLLDSLVRFEPIVEIFRWLSSRGKKSSDLTQVLYESVPEAPRSIQNCVAQFKQEILDEMHETELQAIEFMQANEAAYESGERGGGNLRYSNQFWFDHFNDTFRWIVNELEGLFPADADALEEIKTIEAYLAALYVDRLPGQAVAESLDKTFKYHISLWAETTEVLPLSDFKGETTYRFAKTPVSDVESLVLWQNFGFKMKQGMKRLLPGYLNRLWISKLRRTRELVHTQSKVDISGQAEMHLVGKIAIN